MPDNSPPGQFAPDKVKFQPGLPGWNFSPGWNSPCNQALSWLLRISICEVISAISVSFSNFICYISRWSGGIFLSYIAVFVLHCWRSAQKETCCLFSTSFVALSLYLLIFFVDGTILSMSKVTVSRCIFRNSSECSSLVDLLLFRIFFSSCHFDEAVVFLGEELAWSAVTKLV